MLTATLDRRPQQLTRFSVWQLAWYGAGALFAFLIPFVFSSVLNLDHDLYYLIYFVGAGTFIGLYASATQAEVVGLFTRNWRWSLVLGLIAGAFVVSGVFNREDATPHPEGIYFVFSIGWRGVVYGAIDGLLLTAFPAAVAYALLESRVDTLVRRGAYAALTLALVLVITATYHLGYEQFRENGVSGPETGNTIISVPALLTTNPLGSVIAHSAMHVAAVVHAYETDLYLPPQTEAD